ncbi:MAG: DNA (cytosine-5-)-methyltransferase [Enterocloster citroniae]|nr:DNA (cytosine-5-)-methyltransferase [Enterocloster citroniae]
MGNSDTEKRLTLCSLFDGSGGFCLAGLLAGIQPVSCSEIEPFPIRVTTKRLPFVKHLGDINSIHGDEIEPVDIITFGSPCTDMSVAGKRAGLDGKQSSLFYQAIRIIKEMRCATDGKYPRFIVWENVPGAFSSNKGEDFRCVLEEICSVKDEGVSVPGPPKGKWPNAGEIVGDGYSVAFRQLDAQMWGVPQRRKRIYLVGDFAGWGAGKILFESEGVSGYSAEGFRAWQGAARHTEEGAGAAGGVRGAVTCLCDQGGQRMDVMQDTACTLRAEAHHPLCVLESAGFCTEHSAQARGIGYEEETSPTLRAGTVPAAVMFENHSQDTRYTGPLETAPTVSATYGMGGNNQPFVAEPDTPKTMKVRAGKSGGGKGILLQEDKSATLSCNNDQTVFVPVRAYGICSKDSNAMKSDNPHSGFYEAETSRTLDGNGGHPGCNQGGIAVVAVQGSMIGREGRNGPQGSGVNEGVSFTLNATDHHAVAYPTYCTSKNSHFTRAEKELANTLVATDYKDPPVINDMEKEPDYIVRRLTPTECARLQGFPDWWCSGLGTEEPTGDDLVFWREVFETHRKAMGTSKKPKTDNQIIKWLKDPHSDSAEYKMWGNGIYLGNAYFVLSGIVYYAQFPEFLL